ncbi:MAG: universal stress protein, partial [Rhodospirillales bacterium]|nr:universal stress protein [Rhodospirillales bacterium]
RDHAFLNIVHAWEVDGIDYDVVRSETSPHRYNSILEEHKRNHRLALENLLARYSMVDLDYCVHLPREKPEHAIDRIVKQKKIDLIVMGTLAHTGVPGFFIGSTAESVMSLVKCGMLTVKPDSFQTPITLLDQPYSRSQELEPFQDDLRNNF